MDSRRRSRTHPAAFVAVLAAVLVTGGLAAADKPVAGPVGNPEMFFNVGFSPTKLSKKRSEPTPISFDFSFFRKVVDGQPPPPLREFVLEGDKHAGVDVRGIPTCGGSRLDVRRSFGEVREMCRPALIGSGHMEVAVKFPDEPMLTLGGRVLAINGGVKDGVTRMHLTAYLPAPVTGWTVFTVEIRKVRKDRYGLEAVASIPKIAGGAGSVTKFSLSLKRGIVSAACPDGRLNARGTAVLADGTSSYGTVIRTCTGRLGAEG